MPFDGNGNWTSNFNAEADRDAGYKILASRFDNILLADIAQSFENCLTKDTQIKPQTNFNANNYRIINVANPEDDSDALNYGKFRTGNNTLTGNNTFSGQNTFSGKNTFSDEIIYTNGNSIRFVGNGYGKIFHQSSAAFYLLLTNQNDEYGDYNSLRPFSVNLTNGVVTTMPNSATHGIVTTEDISKGGSGFVKLGNGIIIQWGNVSISSYDATGTITFPTAFSGTGYSFASAGYRASDGQGSLILNSHTASSVKYRIAAGSSNYANIFYWIAIGY